MQKQISMRVAGEHPAAGSGWLKKAVRTLIRERQGSHVPVEALWDDFLASRELSLSRIRHYAVILKMVRRYEAYVRASLPGMSGWRLMVDEVDLDILNDMKDYFKEEYVYVRRYPQILEDVPEERGFGMRSENYLHSVFKMLKAFFSWCRKEGHITTWPFAGFVMPKEEYGTPVILTLDEVERLLNAPMPYRRLERQRDIFVFQCQVGCRVGDMLKFTKKSVQHGTLEYIAGKTIHFSGRTVVVPLNEIARNIVRKYRDLPGDRLLPFVSEQNYNRYIKDAFTMAGLNRIVTTYDPVRRCEVKLHLNKIASSHLARRTFAGNIYRKVKDPNLVSALTGHAEGSKAFNRYREIDIGMKRDLVRILENKKRTRKTWK